MENNLHFNILCWTVTALSLTGTILNIKKKRICFFIWAATNSSWAIIDFLVGLHAQAALFLIYTALAIWGIIEWRVDGKNVDTLSVGYDYDWELDDKK